MTEETTTVRNREAHEAADRASTYEHGWSSAIEQDFAPKGLNEDTVRFISAKKKEPLWLLEWRLKAFAMWQKMEEPRWAAVKYPPIDYQDAYYYAAPKQKVGPKSLDEVDPELLRTYAKLGIPLKEQAILAGVEGACAMKPHIGIVTRTVRDALKAVTLAQLAGTPALELEEA